MAEVRIQLHMPAEDPIRGLIVDCTVRVLQTVLRLPPCSVSFAFEAASELQRQQISVAVSLFPAGSARMRRTACAALVREISAKLQLPPEEVDVHIVTPPQEKVL